MSFRLFGSQSPSLDMVVVVVLLLLVLMLLLLLLLVACVRGERKGV